MNNQIVLLNHYYQDVCFQPLKCIDLFKLEYKIKTKNKS